MTGEHQLESLAVDNGSETERRVDFRQLIFLAAAVPLLVLALFSLFNSFFFHLTPDVSIYLLHARTFAETLNRYTYSHDSKGILLAALLSGPVASFGPNVVAASALQTMVYSIAAFLMMRFARASVGRRTAMVLGPLWITAAFSPLMWGGRMRPEDLGVLYLFLGLTAARSGGRKLYFVGGLAVSAAFFTKTTLCLAPAAAMGAGLLFCVRDPRVLIRNLAAAVCGISLLAAIVFVWMLIFDDIGAWYRQAIEWPVECKSILAASGIVERRDLNVLALFGRARLGFLFLAGFSGLFYAMFKGQARSATTVLVALTAELIRSSMELAVWNYLITMMLPLLMVGIGFFGLRRARGESLWGWALCLVALLPVLSVVIPEQIALCRARVLSDRRTQSETLANRMEPFYRPGETLTVTGNDYSILLHLNAPRPYPILMPHLALTTPEEIRATKEWYEANPPDWIIDNDPRSSPVAWRNQGMPDDLVFYYLDVPSTGSPPRNRRHFYPGDVFTPRYPTREYRHQLLAAEPYQLMVDIGVLQAWKRQALVETESTGSRE